jgi:hypothetical protein
VKKICIVVNFFIWIVIKNYWCDIKSEKSENVLMLIVIENLKKWKKKYIYSSVHYSVMFRHLTNKPMVFALFYLIWCIDSWIMGYLCWIQSHSRCLADICGALHCDIVMDSVPRKTKCNPAAAAKNQHLCEVAYVWVMFPIVDSSILFVFIF